MEQYADQVLAQQEKEAILETTVESLTQQLVALTEAGNEKTNEIR